MKKLLTITLLLASGLAAAFGAPPIHHLTTEHEDILAKLATPRFLTTDHELILAKIPPPPANDSPAGMADVETLLQVQKDRTPEQVARAVRINAHAFLSIEEGCMGQVVFGPAFTGENLPRTAAILRQATAERRVVMIASKNQWNRVRPHKRGLGVEPCVDVPRSASYPSGHSSCGVLWAMFLGGALPEYKTLFDDAAREIMWSRVLAGAHYPSDTQAGRLLGQIIVEEMLKNQSTQNAVKEMRAELLEFLEKYPEARARAEGLKD
ncbi:acid phosphatase (class A) [Ereboglobus sp. PH5-5]|uniref:phosphatase PAP2 family protein n=1 Tax=unclassified Ereboglobus TaxID=2626932 RepID=UPI0024065E18|nr:MULTISPECIES: phosphatase PAP2 family protein [unclassified Ereboglobus]MDF9826799.1 acid phosphatase (class A) [Ereboglobus sp. PH5-10]MDF9831846.1 acid phosphatase (class A) [Ereboglobus sp. PH5-5]